MYLHVYMGKQMYISYGQTDVQMYRQMYIWANRCTYGKTDVHMGQTDVHMDRQIYLHVHMDRQMYRCTDRCTYGQTDVHMDRQMYI